MSRIPFFRRAFRRTFRVTRFRTDVERDVRDEIEVYLELRAQELVDEGMDPEAARAAALAAFGDRRRIEQECRQIAETVERRSRWSTLLGSLATDARLAVRDLRRRPGFALAVCLTLAVSVALSATVLGVFESIVLRPLPFEGAERIAAVYNSYPEAGAPRAPNSAPDYFDRRAGVPAFEAVALYQERTHTMGEPGSIRRSYSLVVTPSFFDVLGVEPFLGRAFTDEETEPGRDDVAVIGHRLWQEAFGGDPEIVGRDLRIEGVRHTVVGVMPEGFQFPKWDAQLFLPVTFTPWLRSDDARHSNFFDMLARLHPDASLADAETQLARLNASLVDRIPAKYRQRILDSGYRTVVESFHADLVRDVRGPLVLLAGAALLVLVIGAVTITNLMLVRSTGRRRELAARHALGAGGVRLVRQLVTESWVLASVGGSLGLTVAAIVLQGLDVFESYQVPRIGEVRVDPSTAAVVLLAAFGVMTVAALISALSIRRVDPFAILRTASSTGSGGSARLRGALVAAQIAVAVVLAVGAGLLLATMANLNRVDPGFEPDGVLAGALKLTPPLYPDSESRQRFLDDVLREVGSLPGVSTAAVASQLPFSGWGDGGPITPEGGGAARADEMVAHFGSAVSSDYFEVLGIPLRTGRWFTDSDRRDTRPVVVVSEEVARRYWGENGFQRALGQRVFLGTDPGEDAEWRTVVGVVADIRQEDLREDDPAGAYYVPLRQSGVEFVRLVARLEAGDPHDALPALRERIFGVDPEMPLFWTETLDESVAGTLIPVRAPMQLLLVFAAVSMGLAALGVYAVLAQSVAERSREISIRMALGSARSAIYRWVLLGMTGFVGAGLAVGVLGALALSRTMRSLLFEVAPGDPRILAAVALAIGVVALLASLAPARRATRIDPAKALDAP